MSSRCTLDLRACCECNLSVIVVGGNLKEIFRALIDDDMVVVNWKLDVARAIFALLVSQTHKFRDLHNLSRGQYGLILHVKS